MKPYFETKLGKLYHGDSREILPEIGSIETIITDPVWPGARADIPGRGDAWNIFGGMCRAMHKETQRLIVQIGCDINPSFLCQVPERLPFLRTCWLDYARPSFKGRLMYTGDVAFAFGFPPAFIKGRQVMPGMCRSGRVDRWQKGKPNKKAKDFDRREYNDLPHPMPRRLEHVRWLVYQFSDKQVCDPFMGSGTTGVACESYGRQWIGIETEEAFCEVAAQRIQLEAQQLKFS